MGKITGNLGGLEKIHPKLGPELVKAIAALEKAVSELQAAGDLAPGQFGDPTGLVSLDPVSGTSKKALRSDSAPALNPIIPLRHPKTGVDRSVKFQRDAETYFEFSVLGDGVAVQVSPGFYVVPDAAATKGVSVVTDYASGNFNAFEVFQVSGATVIAYLDAQGYAKVVAFGLGVTPATAQAGGVATAGAAYGATEQAMLQKVYDTLRTFGFLT